MTQSCHGSDSSSAGRSGCGVDPAREARLGRAGWSRRTTLEEPRLSQAVEGYEALGFEVHLEPFDPQAQGDGECIACFQVGDAAARFWTIFTRRPGTNG